MGESPSADVTAHAAQVAVMKYLSEGLRYLGSQLRRLLEVVVLDHRGVLDGLTRQQELGALLELLAKLAPTAPPTEQRDLEHLHTGLRHALPKAVVFTQALDRVQRAAATVLGGDGLGLVGWACSVVLSWLGSEGHGPPATTARGLAWCGGSGDGNLGVCSTSEQRGGELAQHPAAAPGCASEAVSWAAGGLAQSSGLSRGVHEGTSLLQLSGMADVPTDWLAALGYPPANATTDAKPDTTKASEMPMAT